MNILAKQIVKARLASCYINYHLMAYLLLRPNRFFYTEHLTSEQVEGLINFFNLSTYSFSFNQTCE